MPVVTPTQRSRAANLTSTQPYRLLIEMSEGSTGIVHRAVVGNENFVFEGNTFIATDMAVKLPGSSVTQLRASLEMSNLTRVPSRAAFSARERVGCRLVLTDAVSPSTAIIDTKNMLVFESMGGDSRRVSGELGPRASLQEPYPFYRSTKDIFPGAYL